MAKKTSKGKVAAEIGAGLVAAGAAAAVGYYFYGSKHAKAHRKIAAKWATDLKKEVMREAKRLEKINARDFAKIVDTAAAALRGARSINATDLKRAANELKANWEMVQSEMKKTSRKTVSHAKAVGKRAVASTKKTVKKVAKKAVSKSKVRKSR
ncbi:MAG: hypothetical protein WAV50_03275 [Minisyncoccia bacterium]